MKFLKFYVYYIMTQKNINKVIFLEKYKIDILYFFNKNYK